MITRRSAKKIRKDTHESNITIRNRVDARWKLC